jgi:transcription initiation factor TFIIB
MSFLIKETTNQVPSEFDIKKCNYCKSNKIIFDDHTGEKICSNCGVVLGQEFLPAGPLTEAALNTHQFSLASHDRNLSTIIPSSRVDANGMAIKGEQYTNIQKLRHWNKVSDTNRSYHRNLRKAFAILIRIKDRLSLSDPIVEKSAYYYRKILDMKLIKGRSISGFVTASVYTACREMGVARTLAEIAEVSNGDKVFAAKCYRLLAKQLKIRLPSMDPSYSLNRMANKAGISQRTLRHAMGMMTILKDDTVSFGKDPNALAVAVLYGACLEKGEKISQSQITKAGNISTVTLRKRFLDVKKIFTHLPNGP